MKVYVGVTDTAWYQFLSARDATEVNFWQPSGTRRFAAIPPGAPFVFKTHYPENRLVGGGFLSGWAPLSVSQAWDFFGEANGASSEEDMRRRINKYRPRAAQEPDPAIGCIMLRDVHFLPPAQTIRAPGDWAPNIVQGKTYDVEQSSASWLEEILKALLGDRVRHMGGHSAEEPGRVAGDIFGPPRLTPVRVGQGAFKALVQEAYGRRCAVTGDKIVPVLQAAHIRPVTAAGENRVDNGLLLRSDVHTLFDRGYLGVHPVDKRLLVSPRLQAEWGNGEEFYAQARSREPIRLPARRVDRPNREFLEWHADSLFKSA